MSPWVKLDDGFHSNPKVNQAWRSPYAVGLYAMALSYCGNHLTDGFVHDSWVEQKLPLAKERNKATTALVDAGLWDRTRGGWVVNDYLTFNPSREATNERREAERLRKAKERQLSARTNPGLPQDSEHPHTRAPAQASRPVPSRPENKTSSSLRAVPSRAKDDSA